MCVCIRVGFQCMRAVVVQFYWMHSMRVPHSYPASEQHEHFFALSLSLPSVPYVSDFSKIIFYSIFLFVRWSRLLKKTGFNAISLFDPFCRYLTHSLFLSLVRFSLSLSLSLVYVIATSRFLSWLNNYRTSLPAPNGLCCSWCCSFLFSLERLKHLICRGSFTRRSTHIIALFTFANVHCPKRYRDREERERERTETERFLDACLGEMLFCECV